MSPTTVWAWERGIRRPREESLEKFARGVASVALVHGIWDLTEADVLFDELVSLAGPAVISFQDDL